MEMCFVHYWQLFVFTSTFLNIQNIYDITACIKLYQRLLQSFINRFFEMCNLFLHPFEARVEIVSW